MTAGSASMLASLGPAGLISYTIWIGTLPMVVFAPGLLDTIASAPLDATLGVVYLGVVAGALAQCVSAYALSRIPASRAASFLYLIPGLAVILGWGYLGEMPSEMSLAGGGLTLAGAVLVNSLGQDRSPHPSPGVGGPHPSPLPEGEGARTPGEGVHLDIMRKGSLG